METQISKTASLLIWVLIAFLLSQNIVSSFEDQKAYYHSPPPTDPHTRSPPSRHTPSHGGTPPANCGTPPSTPHYDPTPSVPPSPHHNLNPAPPSGGGYHYSPPTVIYPPTTPIDPGTPSISSPPSPPTVIYPPTTPIDPGTPSIPTPPFSIPTPPFSISTPPFDPNSPPFTCYYWINHPGLIFGVFGFLGTTPLNGAFGVPSLPGIGSHLSIQQALSNTRNDGLGSLYREGTASLLNSMIYSNFHFTPAQVRDHFVSALGSNKAAASQARLFKLANEGRLKPRTL